MKTYTSVEGRDLSRREFIANTAIAGTALLAAPTLLAQSSSAPAATSAPRKKRYALVGVGGRSGMFRDAVMKTYADHCEMVGFCDINLGRLQLAQRKARDSA
ncbi:MAG TPA: twin-arginine translocation signal domain-containing protein, partial [Verrucomicrobiota bacterium]|nr:twin-arginine translocation signal domain-containing protein [Verrucomicrobiota bacterium]